MKGTLKYIIVSFLLLARVSFGQISPGDLSQAHAHLEGMSKCTSCHDLGKQVSNTKCLDCHTEIKTRQNKKKGYHSDEAVIKKSCFDCHSDHHGRKFDMARFDTDKFDHNQTGYRLEGKHKTLDCKQCHIPENIHDAELKKRPNTFLGLDQECLTCHDDYHQKTLSNKCSACHNFEAFKPAAKFDHNKADFKLRGKHNSVDCKGCHTITTRNGSKFQEFTNLSFYDCKACHTTPHGSRIKGKCSQCHNENTFSNFIGKGRFDHATTDFTLKGSHKKVDCFACHSKTTDPKLVFQDKKPADENKCISCHTDVHDGKFGNDCASCHNEGSFLILNKINSFDHGMTDYPLEGKHLKVECKKCHTGKYPDPIDFSACNNCHEDYHNGEFMEKGISPDCKECHSLEKGFEYSLYTLGKHQMSSFPLEGAHIATPCFACHVSDDRWTFKDLNTDCYACHEDIHQGYISEKYYPGKACNVCHINDAWHEVNFDHKLTDWPLEGKHTELSCRSCHFKDSDDDITINQAFSNLQSNCASCHENIHGDLFVINGVTECERCHVTDSWFPRKFDHNSTAFPLEGRHAEIDCQECHITDIEKEDKPIIYKIAKFECIDCHQ